MDVAEFYDGLAADYHLVYGGRWDDAINEQGTSLARLIRTARPDATTVLDCSCGIGTQAIGLAGAGFRVTGSDLSASAVERARTEARRHDVPIDFTVADFRDLDDVGGPFDVVLSADNALPHLLDDADVSRALTAMRDRLEPGGLLVLTIRDYDRALVERPPVAPPTLVDGPPRRVVVRLHDWDSPTSRHYTVRFLVCTEYGDGEWSIREHHARYRAMTRAELSALAQSVGLVDIAWHQPDETGFYQPVLTATAR